MIRRKPVLRPNWQSQIAGIGCGRVAVGIVERLLLLKAVISVLIGYAGKGSAGGALDGR